MSPVWNKTNLLSLSSKSNRVRENCNESSKKKERVYLAMRQRKRNIIKIQQNHQSSKKCRPLLLIYQGECIDEMQTFAIGGFDKLRNESGMGLSVQRRTNVVVVVIEESTLVKCRRVWRSD